MSLTVGDPTPWFVAPIEGVDRFNFSSLAGRWVDLVFAPDGATADKLAQSIAQQPALDESNVCLFGVTTAVLGSVSLGPRWFFDASGGLAKLYGVSGVAWLILDPMLRVYDRGTLDDIGALVKRLAQLAPAETHAGVELNAPVLILPRVFEPAFCQDLMAIYRSHGGTESGFMREVNGNTVLVNDARYKQRKDVEMDEPAQQAAVQERIGQRLLPEIRNLPVQRHAHRALSGGSLRRRSRLVRSALRQHDAGHGVSQVRRDHQSQRRSHECGDLRFPEFGNRRYRAPMGGCSGVFVFPVA